MATPNPAYVGQTVRLKPARADAYGFNRTVSYKIRELYHRPGYAALWAKLEGGSMREPLNRVKVSELQTA